MIKQFKDISEKELNYMRNHQVIVKEKLDTIKFKVVIEDGEVDVYASKGRKINNIDAVINSINKSILCFVNNEIKPNSGKIMSLLGNCDLDFFYMPVAETHVIKYRNPDNQFILSHVNCSNDNDDLSTICEIIDGVRPFDPIKIWDSLPGIKDVKDDITNISVFTNGETWSGNDIDDIEGIIVICGKKTYQILRNPVNPEIDKTTKKIYRDMILENFCNTVYNNPGAMAIIDKREDYVKMMSDLFMVYINTTNIFTKIKFDVEDLLPPNAGFIGDIDYDALPISVKYICKGNEIYKNILRILLVTFDKDKGERFGNMDGFEQERLSKLYKMINY